MVTIDEVRSLALSLPEVEEYDHWGKPSFRVRNKIFAVIQPDGVSLVIKTTKDDRLAYTTMAPEVYRIPDSFSNLAFMIVRMDRVEPNEFHDLLTLSWKLVSPKKLVKAYDEPLLKEEHINGASVITIDRDRFIKFVEEQLSSNPDLSGKETKE